MIKMACKSKWSRRLALNQEERGSSPLHATKNMALSSKQGVGNLAFNQGDAGSSPVNATIYIVRIPLSSSQWQFLHRPIRLDTAFIL